MNIRTFIALEISDVIRNQITLIQKQLANKGAEVKWSKKENIHLTLKFMGEIDDKKHVKIIEAIDSVGENTRRLKLFLTELGMFPNEFRPTVIWVGIGGEVEELRQMAERCDYYLTANGFEIEKIYFNPHITIGRIKKLTNKKRFISEVNSIKMGRTKFEVENLHVVKSDLKSTGVIYTNLHSIHFNNYKLKDSLTISLARFINCVGMANLISLVLP